MYDACEDLGQNYLRADIIQSLALGIYNIIICFILSLEIVDL
eukprot:COSAG05_NODE_2659_length_2793_cov_11.754640_4_plen_42_part_00